MKTDNLSSGIDESLTTHYSLLTTDSWISYIHELQDRICKALEQEDGKAVFTEDKWNRAEGGGGKTKVIANGNVFEKGGVNSSVVYGKVSDAMRSQLKISGDNWFACGLSIVIHPLNPFVPTVHANWRYFELYDASGKIMDRWFGGGADLTPYYLFEEDAKHFHQTLRDAILPFGEGLYPEFKRQCDAYFSNTHRGNEMRGIGGVFYDYLRPQNEEDANRLFAFQRANGDCFINAYIPFVAKRKHTKWSEAHKHWQEIRRGRYVEFNLIHDRGTLFGLKTNGRTESILMSLPPTVRFEYNYRPEPGSEEDRLLQVCLHPKEWV
ncbi:oxygen-dependent coproporphyrinogen oxidase [Agriterribacter sp.]|uniref:oxygen-dependent coproporphyrinogen oxidase n=1 Tax=Agriterribacter sp. TaxID=2821509 RepID=UPI002BE94B54|nr:oxygen-dependent coproporphyrinogen oxidase [Agriterribacter sp.]HRP56096.1 oxygen-dependent coproporphyrinogen oxidase [Agriterribacter sp.]